MERHEIQGFNFFLPVLIQRLKVCLLSEEGADPETLHVLHCLIKKTKSILLNLSCVLISLHKQTVWCAKILVCFVTMVFQNKSVLRTNKKTFHETFTL